MSDDKQMGRMSVINRLNRIYERIQSLQTLDCKLDENLQNIDTDVSPLFDEIRMKIEELKHQYTILRLSLPAHSIADLYKKYMKDNDVAILPDGVFYNLSDTPFSSGDSEHTIRYKGDNYYVVSRKVGVRVGTFGDSVLYEDRLYIDEGLTE